MKKIVFTLLAVILMLFPNIIVYADEILDGFIVDTSLLTGDLKVDNRFDYALIDSTGRAHNTLLTRTTEGKIAYCADGTKNMFAAGDGHGEIAFDTNCKVISDNQAKTLSYIFENGYKGEKEGEYSINQYLTGTPLTDYYITQCAIWYHTTASEAYKNDFNFTNKTFNGKSSDIISKIINLIADAKTAGNGATLDINLPNTNMSLTSDEKYYISSAINLTGTYLNSNITASVSGPKGTFVTSNKNASSGSTRFQNGSTVYIKVPAENVNTGSTNVNLSISASTYIENSDTVQCEYKYASSYNIQPIVINYQEDAEITESQNLTITKKEIYSVSISKKNSAGNMLEGAELILKNRNIIIARWITTNEVKKVNLNAGVYTIEETMAPDGYVDNDTKLTFTIDDSGIIYINNSQVEEISLINEPIMVTISKQEKNKDAELAGATLRITDEEGNIAKDASGNLLEWITTNEAQTFHLIAGSYTLEEIASPEGYELSDKQIEFTVNKDGTVTIKEGTIIVKDKLLEDNLLVFENTKEPEDVQTGSILIYITTTIGILALVSTIYLIYKKKII